MERIKKEMPDTLFLEERAQIALNALIGVADEDYGYIPFFNGNFKAKPAYMTHGNWDFGSSHGRLVDAIILARAMTGSTYGEEIEKYYRRNLLSFFKEDGLSYRKDIFSDKIKKEHQAKFTESASMIDQRAVVLGMATWFLATKDEKVKDIEDKHVAALKKIARKERESWYYPASEYTTAGWPSLDAIHTRLAVDPASMWGRQIGPLLRYYKGTGNKDALELVENFSSNIIYRSGVFNKDGSFNGALEYRNGHFHTRMGTLASLAAYGSYIEDSSIIEYVKKSYDWALNNWCTKFGWTPGDMHDQRYEHETCTLVDAIHVGIILAQAGYVEYWGKVERFLRNHLTESQLLEIDWIEDLDDKSMDIPKKRTYYNVAQRLKGSFSGYSAPNDFVYDGQWGRGHIMDVQTCCLGAGTRGLYLGWSHIVTEKQGKISVNLLLNRSTPWLNVKSYMPHEGKVVLDINQDIPELLVRIPEWTPFGAVEVNRIMDEDTIFTTGRKLSWFKNAFMRLGAARKGEKIIITFPMMEKKIIETASGLDYEVKWRGDDVVHIDPPGTYYPIYNNRRIYEKTPVKEVTITKEKGDLYI